MKKIKNILLSLLVLVMMTTLLLDNAYADIPDVLSGQTYDVLETGHIGINSGTINRITNTGTLGVNEGLVKINNSSVNPGIIRNEGTIETNVGYVEGNYGEIIDNNGTADNFLTGKVKNNNAGGKLSFKKTTQDALSAGSVENNKGTIDIYDGDITVTTNDGTIILHENAKLTCTTNNGLIKKSDFSNNATCTCTTNNGYILLKQLYEIKTSGIDDEDLDGIEIIDYDYYDSNKYYTENDSSFSIKVSNLYMCDNYYSISNDFYDIIVDDTNIIVNELNTSDNTFTVKFHKHILSDYINDEIKHWKTCSICGDKKLYEEEHVFGRYVSDGNATYENDGTKSRTCSLCGYIDTVTDPGSMLRHSSSKRKKDNDLDKEKEPEQDKIIEEEQQDKIIEKELDNKDLLFSDLLPDEKNSYDWAKDSVYNLAKKGIINGYDDNTYKPENNIKRNEFSKLACLVLNIKEDKTLVNKFVDIDDDWAKDKIIALSSKEIINGYDDNHFGPNDYLTNEQMITILIKGIKYLDKDVLLDDEKEIDDELNKMSDKESVSSWARPYVATAIKYELIVGNDNKEIEALSNINRAKTSVILDRYINLLSKLNIEIK